MSALYPSSRRAARWLAEGWGRFSRCEVACLLRGLTFGEVLNGLAFAFTTFVLLALMVVL